MLAVGSPGDDDPSEQLGMNPQDSNEGFIWLIEVPPRFNTLFER